MEYERENAEYEAFCAMASIALEHEAARLLNSAFDRLSSLECSWHPNGFAVFHIDEHHELGNLRLHIWPDTKRTARPDGAPIHTHVWHLCSRILVGTYTETLYKKSGPDSLETTEYHSASIDYLIDRDSFTTPGHAYLKPLTTTRNTGGHFHTVPADVPHQTHIEEASFVATLLITSLPVSKKVAMYSPEKIPVSHYKRPVLSQDRKMELLDRLKQELTIEAGHQN